MRKSPSQAEDPFLGDDWRIDNAGRLLGNAQRRFEERVMSLMADRGHVQTRRWHVNLTRHLDVDGTRITELAKRASMTNAAMTELIDQCEAMGLVERVVDPSDRRVRMVHFTEAGLKWLADFGRSVRQAQREMEAVIGASALQHLLTNLALYGGTGEPDTAKEP